MQWCWFFLALLSAQAAPPANVPEAELKRALQQMEARNYEAGAATLKPLVKQSPSDPNLWNLLGICESEQDHDGAARSAFLSGLKIAPQSVSLNENLGFFYYRRADFPSAKTYLSKAVALGSGTPGIRFSLAAARVRTGEEERGLAELKSLEHQLEGEADYWTERGWVELRKQPKASTASFDRALGIAPDDVRALNGAASAAEAAGEDEKALGFLMRAKQSHAEDVRTLLHLTAVCLRRDLSVDALAAVKKAYELAPSNNLALFLYAQTEIAFQQWQHSHELFSEFIRRIPDYAPAEYALGWLDVKLNRPGEARQHLQRSLALSPDHADTRYELGQLDISQGDLGSAEKQLRAVIAKQPAHSKALVALGDLMLKREQLSQAKGYYERAIAADPRSGPAHYKLSTVLIRLNETSLAAKERAEGAALNAEAVRAGKTVLVLAAPDGALLSGDP
jgi:Tfp pilus assembly protein PilF